MELSEGEKGGKGRGGVSEESLPREPAGANQRRIRRPAIPSQPILIVQSRHGSKGRVALGERFANRTVIIEEIDETEVRGTIAGVVPEREMWLHGRFARRPASRRASVFTVRWTDEAAQADDRGTFRVATLRFMKSPFNRPPASPWHGRRVIVAGGTSGFGLVLARHLLGAGASVLLVGRSADGVRRALERLPEPLSGSKSLGTAADLARRGEGGRVVGEALDRLGGVDDLFFSVGRSGRALILDTSADQLAGFLDANLRTAVEITTAAAEDVARARGHMVYVGSLAGKLVTPLMGPYAVAKSALAAYVDAVRLEMAPQGAHVLLVSPGPIRREAADDDATFDRYADEVAAAGLPAEANRPGGGAPLRRLDPDSLAEQIFEACRRRTSELVVPRKAAWLAGLVEWFPDWGRQLLARFTPAPAKTP